MNAQARNVEIVELYRSGETSTALAAKYGVSPQRVCMILHDNGLNRWCGGKHVSAIGRAITTQQRTGNKRFLVTYGCTKEIALSVNGGEALSARGSAASKYQCQRKSAKRRGIAWDFTFPQWVRVWADSGKWAFRAKGTGYVMARIGDLGPYSEGNVEIITQSQNSKDSFIKSPHRVRFYGKKSKTHCVRGHALTPENKNKWGYCKQCQRIRELAYYEKLKESRRLKKILRPCQPVTQRVIV